MTLQELHDYLYDSKTPRNPRLFIDNYENNLILISNADLSILTEYDYAMRLTCDYAISLESTGHLKKGIEYIDKAIDLIENFPDFQKDKLYEIQYYELMKFHKARALYNLKKYDESLSIFEELDRVFPKNDKYISWINGIKNKKIDRLTWIATGIMLIILLSRTFYRGKNITFDNYTFWLLFLSFLFFIVCFVLNMIQRARQKKINAT